MPKSKLLNNLIYNEKVETREEMLDGRTHLVVPATILVEGVHSGTGGPVYYPSEELKKSVPLWNGVPVPIRHPVDKDGNPRNVNSPEVINEFVTGRVFNAAWEDEKVRAELWLDREKFKTISPDIFAMLSQNKNVEISSSLYTSDDETPGEWNGEKYIGTVSRFIPNHVAILGEEAGACGFKDGCGIRNNSEKKITFHCNVATMSHAELEKELREKLKEKYPPVNPDGFFPCYITDVWDNRFVYEHNIINGGFKLFQQDFKIRKDKVTFVGEPEEVEKKYSYIPVNNKEVNMERSEIVTKILANAEVKKELGLEAETKETFEKMDDKLFKVVSNAFNRITGCKCQEEKKEEEKKEEKKEEAAINNKQTEEKLTKPKTAEEYISEAPPEVKELLSNSLRLHNAKKAALVKALIANSRNKFSQAQLNSKSMEELEMLTELADVPVSFEGKLLGELKSNKEEVPECPKIDWTKD